MLLSKICFNSFLDVNLLLYFSWIQFKAKLLFTPKKNETRLKFFLKNSILKHIHPLLFIVKTQL